MSDNGEIHSVPASTVAATALANAFAEAGCMVSGILGIVTWVDPDGAERYSFFSADGQGAVQTAGLARILDRDIDEYLGRAFGGSGE